MMHDVAYLESNGIPAVALVSDGFKPQLAYQAAMLGFEHVRVEWVRHPIQCNTEEQIAQKAAAAFPGVARCLSSSDEGVLQPVAGSVAPPVACDS